MTAQSDVRRTSAPVAYVTVEIDGQPLGIPIERVRDVFTLGQTTRVPLAPADVVGLINLRGRVVTAIDLRVRLGLPRVAVSPGGHMAVGLDVDGDSYGLVVDGVGEVVRLDRSAFRELPAKLPGPWATLISGVHRRPDHLLLILDVDAVLGLDKQAIAA